MSQNDHTGISAKARRALEMTDDLSPELRACVHEFGAQIVNTMMQYGVTSPHTIRSIVHSCWMGAREPHQRHGAGIKRSTVAEQLDWLLLQNGSGMSAATLLRLLWGHSMVIVPRDPSLVMVEASMATVTGRDVSVPKYTKHKLRLAAGIEAVARKLWPQMFAEAADV